MDVSARLTGEETTDTELSTAQEPANDVTATRSKFSPDFRSFKPFQTILIPAGASSRCNSSCITAFDWGSRSWGKSAYRASVRVCACAQIDKHRMSNSALNVHNM